jgi:hypothetical protein
MADLITRFIKWLISVSAFIYGCSFLMMVEDSGEVRPMILVIFCFGIVYWMSKSTYEGSKKLFYVTLAILLSCAAIPFYYNPNLLAFTVSYYFSWNVWVLIFGLPIMLYLFKNDD